MKLSNLLILVLPATLTGCLSFTTLVKVKPDGSGTITTTTRMSAEFVKQMEEMQKAFQSADAKAEKKELFPESEAKEAAAKMGEGVTFVKAEKIKDAQGEGLRATYAFKDITKIKLSQSPDAPGGATKTNEDAVLFKLTKQGGTSTLTAMFPKKKEPTDAGKKGEKPEAAKGDAKAGEPDPQAMAQMKAMFKDMKFSMQIEVDGKLVKTSCPYVEGNTVTLMEMDFGQLLENEKALESLAKEKEPSLEEAKELLKGIKGIKVVLDPQITIEMS